MVDTTGAARYLSRGAAAPVAVPPSPARLLVFEDSVYRRVGDAVSTDQSFLWFTAHLADRFARVELLGRLDPAPGRTHYLLPAEVRLVPLPHYAALAAPGTPMALLRSSWAVWCALGRADVAWVMGPHPLSLLLVLLARLRGTPVVLGVRQDLPAYARHRHPDRRWTHLAADALEAAWRRMARRRAVVAVGAQLAGAYRASPRAVELGISLVRAGDLATAPAGPGDAGLVALSVGRLETEKNPLLLADVLAKARAADPRWRLVVCGEGPLSRALQERLEQLGVAEHAELRGYVPVDGGLREVYRSASALLHVSWTEGVPQVLFEAWAAGLPIVATDVGGVREVVGDAALLVPAGDASAAADALCRLAQDDDLRAGLVGAGTGRARENTMEAALGRLGDLLEAEAACAG